MKNQIVQARVILSIINQREVHRVLMLKATEICLEFDIKNGSLSMKLQDSVKVAQAKNKKRNAPPVRYARNEYEYGRFTTVALIGLMNEINKNKQLLARLGLKQDDEITNMFSQGKQVAIHAYTAEERDSLDEAIQQSQQRTVNAGRSS